eukprot:Awhi_evm1s5742
MAIPQDVFLSPISNTPIDKNGGATYNNNAELSSKWKVPLNQIESTSGLSKHVDNTLATSAGDGSFQIPYKNKKNKPPPPQSQHLTDKNKKDFAFSEKNQSGEVSISKQSESFRGESVSSFSHAVQSHTGNSFQSPSKTKQTSSVIGSQESKNAFSTSSSSSWSSVSAPSLSSFAPKATRAQTYPENGFMNQLRDSSISSKPPGTAADTDTLLGRIPGESRYKQNNNKDSFSSNVSAGGTSYPIATRKPKRSDAYPEQSDEGFSGRLGAGVAKNRVSAYPEQSNDGFSNRITGKSKRSESRLACVGYPEQSNDGFSNRITGRSKRSESRLTCVSYPEQSNDGFSSRLAGSRSNKISDVAVTSSYPEESNDGFSSNITGRSKRASGTYADHSNDSRLNDGKSGSKRVATAAGYPEESNDGFSTRMASRSKRISGVFPDHSNDGFLSRIIGKSKRTNIYHEPSNDGGFLSRESDPKISSIRKNQENHHLERSNSPMGVRKRGSIFSKSSFHIFENEKRGNFPKDSKKEKSAFPLKQQFKDDMIDSSKTVIPSNERESSSKCNIYNSTNDNVSQNNTSTNIDVDQKKEPKRLSHSIFDMKENRNVVYNSASLMDAIGINSKAITSGSSS